MSTNQQLHDCKNLIKTFILNIYIYFHLSATSIAPKVSSAPRFTLSSSPLEPASRPIRSLKQVTRFSHSLPRPVNTTHCVRWSKAPHPGWGATVSSQCHIHIALNLKLETELWCLHALQIVISCLLIDFFDLIDAVNRYR